MSILKSNFILDPLDRDNSLLMFSNSVSDNSFEEIKSDPDDDSDIETKIEEALNAGVELLRLTQVIK